jgi:hypothetical protein
VSSVVQWTAWPFCQQLAGLDHQGPSAMRRSRACAAMVESEWRPLRRWWKDALLEAPANRRERERSPWSSLGKSHLTRRPTTPAARVEARGPDRLLDAGRWRLAAPGQQERALPVGRSRCSSSASSSRGGSTSPRRTPPAGGRRRCRAAPRRRQCPDRGRLGRAHRQLPPRPDSQRVGVREWTVQDEEQLTAWLRKRSARWSWLRRDGARHCWHAAGLSGWSRRRRARLIAWWPQPRPPPSSGSAPRPWRACRTRWAAGSMRSSAKAATIAFSPSSRQTLAHLAWRRCSPRSVG